MSDRRIPELADLNIKDGDVVAVDLETYDPELKTHGSGAIRGKVRCVVSLLHAEPSIIFQLSLTLRAEPGKMQPGEN